MNKAELLTCILMTIYAMGTLGLEGKATNASESSKLESEIEDSIGLWETNQVVRPYNLCEVTSQTCEKIRKVPARDKRVSYYVRLTDKVLAFKFEDVAEFRLETWGTEPFSLNSNDPKSILYGKHQHAVAIVKELYYGMRKSGIPASVQFDLIFRFAEKVDVEKARLKTLDVGGAGRVLDEAECDLYDLTRGEMTEDKKMLLNRFESTFYRPIRSPEEIAEDRRKLDDAIETAIKRMLKAFKTEDGIRRHGELYRKWKESNGKRR